MPDGDGWVVVWTASRAEKKVTSRIAAQGIEAWLPTVTEKRRWSDRWQEVVTPLFPGYLFARGSLQHWNKLLRTPGVLSVVKEGGEPAVLSDGFITSLKRAVESVGAAVESVKEFIEYDVGEEVVVREGVLAGVRGVVRERRNARQLVIWVQQIGRGVAVTIGSALVSRQ